MYMNNNNSNTTPVLYYIQQQQRFLYINDVNELWTLLQESPPKMCKILKTFNFLKFLKIQG